jgi:hypothetical protein
VQHVWQYWLRQREYSPTPANPRKRKVVGVKEPRQYGQRPRRKRNFTIRSVTCVRADSAIDYVSSNNVSITLLSNNGMDMSATRIIPFFAVADGSFYVSTGTIISSADFYYFDGGGATIPVQGRFLRIRICNDANYDINYAQLTAHGSGTANRNRTKPSARSVARERRTNRSSGLAGSMDLWR